MFLAIVSDIYWISALHSLTLSLLLASPPVIPWKDISLGEKLGEGASGVVFSAQWLSSTPLSTEAAPAVEEGRTRDQGDQGDQGGRGLEVAVKLFKAGNTSDGLPEDEMKVRECLHPS